MTLIVPNDGEVAMLEKIIGQTLFLRLFSNNITPSETTTTGSLTQVTGGGYTEKELVVGNWTVAPGAPGTATYNSPQNFAFTGTTGAPGTVYGYYVVDEDGTLMWAERFEAGVVPFTPVLNSLIRITPRLQLN